ncbi:MAG: hypothetical protein ACI8PZ_006595 [Myxococcota bacterium]|jgi:hypothetical protein
MVRDLYDRGHPDFLAAVYDCQFEDGLKKLATDWGRDSRSFARAALLAYVDDGCDRRDHRALIKRLYKDAEDRGDDELIAHFLVAFDGYHRYKSIKVRGWSWSLRAEITTWKLVNQRDTRYLGRRRFSNRTAHYLKRRAVRTLRRLPDDRYLAAAQTALRTYPTDAFARPEAILGAFGLLHIAYRHSGALRRNERTFALVGALSDLAPAPERPEVWTATALLDVVDSPCAAVRAWAMAMLRADPTALSDVPVSRWLAWLDTPYADLRAFAVQGLRDARGLERLPVTTWLGILASDDAEVVAWAASAVAEHVLPNRFTPEQLVSLCIGRSAGLAATAWGWLADRRPDADAVRAVLDAPHAEVRAGAAAWFADRARTEADPLGVRDLVDDVHADVRQVGLDVMTEAPFADAPVLWAALAESPWSDAVDRLLPHLEARRDLLPPGAPAGLWASTLLSVRRGAANKRAALRQLRARLTAHPAEADALLPLFGVLLRSSRPTERREAVAALGRLAFDQPDLRPAIRRAFPELSLFPEEAA